MMEAYPVLVDGKAEGFVRTFGDYVEVTRGNVQEHYLWLGDRGFGLKTESELFRILYESPILPSLEPREGLLEERVTQAATALRETLDGKLVMADLSGGKDSTAQLLILSRLREHIDFKLLAVYVHVPYLEPPENIDIAERIANKLGVEFLYVEADRRMMQFYLMREGLPRRGIRWCTYLKTRALREARKALGADFEAKGDRMLESGKRMSRLKGLATKSSFVQGRTLNLVYDFTALDAARIVAEHDLVHPHYLLGIPRVSCRFCPYRSLYELKAAEAQEVEDLGLLEHSAMLMYRRHYSSVATWDLFWELALWRYQPTLARLRLKELSNADFAKTLTLGDVKAMFRSLWVR
ncbi:phosphoadenosine phosphosulfate reductase domain-containing protein [Infirmifilum sp. SLHALR2]|nr:MAG: hypothetical protein B7L53_07305 [Thermofilum sp. NZ13]